MQQCDQHYELEMLRQQVILNQRQMVINQEKKRLLRLWTSIQCQINHIFILNPQVLPKEKRNCDINLDDL